jgi:hypothetical protein
MSSFITAALLPTLGVGGFYAEAEFFLGEGGKVFPQKGDTADTEGAPFAHGDTDTAACQDRPMLVIQIQKAYVFGFTIYKDIELPGTDRYLTLNIRQPLDPNDEFLNNDGTVKNFNVNPDPQTNLDNNNIDSAYIYGEELRLYATQLRGDFLQAYNLEASEGGGGDVNWGPNSGEFILKADPSGPAYNNGQYGDVEYDLFGYRTNLWAHALTGKQVIIDRNSQPTSLNVFLTLPTQSEVDARYDNRLLQNKKNRESYFDCVP